MALVTKEFVYKLSNKHFVFVSSILEAGVSLSSQNIDMLMKKVKQS